MKFFASLHSVIGLKTCAIVSFEQVSRPSIIIGPAARAFFRPEEDLRRAWGNVCGKGMALIMSLDPLDLPVLFVCLFVFFFHRSLILTLSWAKKRPCRSADIDGPLASFCQSINQSEEGLSSNRDLIIRVFKSLIVAITFSSHKACNVYTL